MSSRSRGAAVAADVEVPVPLPAAPPRFRALLRLNGATVVDATGAEVARVELTQTPHFTVPGLLRVAAALVEAAEEGPHEGA